jgi:hypothetical protein
MELRAAPQKECRECEEEDDFLTQWRCIWLCSNPCYRTGCSNQRFHTPIQWVPGVLCMRVKRPGREADHSSPSSAEVKNAVSYTSTPPIRLHGVVLKLKSTESFLKRFCSNKIHFVVFRSLRNLGVHSPVSVSLPSNDIYLFWAVFFTDCPKCSLTDIRAAFY